MPASESDNDSAGRCSATTRSAQLRVLVKRILRKHGYPPDKQENNWRTRLFVAEAGLCSKHERTHYF